MSKSNDFDIKPKGLHKPEVIIRAKTESLKNGLKELEEKLKNPEIDIAILDLLVLYARQAGMWAATKLISKYIPAIARAMIPTWFWFALLGVITVIGIGIALIIIL